MCKELVWQEEELLQLGMKEELHEVVKYKVCE